MVTPEALDVDMDAAPLEFRGCLYLSETLVQSHKTWLRDKEIIFKASTALPTHSAR